MRYAVEFVPLSASVSKGSRLMGSKFWPPELPTTLRL
jgi:hypothetical protein